MYVGTDQWLRVEWSRIMYPPRFFCMKINGWKDRLYQLITRSDSKSLIFFLFFFFKEKRYGNRLYNNVVNMELWMKISKENMRKSFGGLRRFRFFVFKVRLFYFRIGRSLKIKIKHQKMWGIKSNNSLCIRVFLI